MKKKSILIDSEEQSLLEVDLESTRDIARLLGCERFAYGVRLDNGDAVYVDDEGLLKKPKFFFKTSDTEWLAGKGLIIGETKTGNLGKARTTLEEAEMMIEYGSLE